MIEDQSGQVDNGRIAVTSERHKKSQMQKKTEITKKRSNTREIK